MKIPNHILNKVEKVSSLTRMKQKLIDEIYVWIEAQGIDHQQDEFADAIGVRICEGEFTSKEEFARDIINYKNGARDMGYG